jgi:hypothetical protein
METATVTIVITHTGAGRDAAGVDYALVALLPEFQSPDIEEWLTANGYAADRPEVTARVLTGRNDWSHVPGDAPRLEVPATDALLQQLGDENGTRGSLTAHPYDEGTYAVALAELQRLGDYLGRRDEIIRVAAASGISREDIDTISGLASIAVERALAPLDPKAFGAAMHAE